MRKKSLVLLFWIALWEVAALWIHNPFLLVTPVTAVKTLGREMMAGPFWISILNSVLKISMGFLAALLAGFLIAAVSYWQKAIKLFLQPMLQVLKTVPMVSFVVLLLIWWGAEWLSFAISFLVSFPNIAIAVLEGLEHTDREQKEVFEIFDISLWTRVFYLYRFSVGPFLQSALKTTLGTCFRAGVAAEVIGMADLSLGGAIYLSKISFDTGQLFAWTFVVILVSYGFERLIFMGFQFLMRMDVPCTSRKRGEAPSPIILKKVSKAFGTNKVLEAIDITYQVNTMNFLTWESGSGKTTLLRCIAGLEQPQEGNISAGKSVSMMFQEDRLLLSLTAMKNLELVCQNRELIKEHLLSLLPEECLERPLEQFSGGMKRRVALVRAMLADGDVVLLDEPFTGMDPETTKRAYAYIEKNQRGRAILIATHNKVEGKV